MKKFFLLLLPAGMGVSAGAQVGIGTTSPTSTLDVRGSVALPGRTVTGSGTINASDYAVFFTGSSAATLTLPDAAACTGRLYVIKNANTATVPVLTVATTALQTIDGSTTRTLSQAGQTLTVASNGTGWMVMAQSHTTDGNAWQKNGDALTAVRTIGTTTNHDLPFITNNTEHMRLTAEGKLGLGSSDFDPTNPEKLLIDAGSTTHTPVNIVGNTNSFFQLNIQNTNNGGWASTDIVATANNGNDNSYYIDMGINSQGYSNGNSNILNGSNTAYLYANAADFYIGNGATGKDLMFFTNTGAWGNNTANGTERMRITSTGNVGIGYTSPSYKLSVNGSVYANNYFQPSDRRLKRDINRLSYGLREVMHLRPVSYYWKTESKGSRMTGFIAQDLRKVIPEAVAGDERTETLRVDYVELIPVLVNAIQEQQKQINELKAELKRLKK